MTMEEPGSSSQWSREQDKAFENGLAKYTENSSDRWEKIAADLDGKSIEEIKKHYEILAFDVNQIEAGLVPLPSYNASSEGTAGHGDEEGTGKKGAHFGSFNGEPGNGGKGSRSDQERRKGIAWTEDEHRLFLLGLDKYGKGDWRSISRNFVVTRTPTQVASHAQKYFIRLNSMNKDRRRSSIHDITSIGSTDIPATGPITGQTNGTAAGGSSGKQTKQSPVSGPTGVAMYGARTVGQPAVGTPVGYGIRPPGSGAVVPGNPVYQTPHLSGPM